MKLNFLVFYGMSILCLVILLDKPIDTVTVISKVVGNLISAYLGFLVGSHREEPK